MSQFDRYQFQLVYLAIEQPPVRNPQQETSETTFDTISESEHLFHTLHTTLFVFVFIPFLK